MPASTVSIIIPAYDEEKTIAKVIEDTMAVMDSMNLPYEIIIVDDGSTDTTRQVATRYKATVVSNGRNRGKGYAVREGIRHAQGEIIVTIDADGEHRPKEIPDLITPLFNGTDIVAGSRFLYNSNRATTRLNRVGNMLFNISIMALTGKRVTDSQTGFRAAKKQVLEKLNLTSTGYEIETEITVKGLRNGFTFQEKPITIERREYNLSKLKILADGTRILRTILTSNLAKIEH
jgi:glycosyltransferase involved in cell wall biosynthesis